MKKTKILSVAISLITSMLLTCSAAVPVKGAEESLPMKEITVSTKTSFISDNMTQMMVQEIIERKEEELRYLSSIIFAEAGNQCLAGQQAVGIIVMNRVACEDYYSDNIIDVIYEKGQFTPTENGAMDKALAMYDEGNLPDTCIAAAQYALEGNTTVIYNNNEYDLEGYLFFARYVKNKKLVIEDHQFK